MEPGHKDDEIDLFELLQKLYNEKWLILGITAITTFIAIAVSLLIPKTYRAEVVFEFPNLQNSQGIQVNNYQIINVNNYQIINPSELIDVFKSYKKY